MLKIPTLSKWSYIQWNRSVKKPIDGYTILLPVPGDLPVFLKIALEVSATQDSEGLVETLVIPDRKVSGFTECFNEWKTKFDISPIRLINPNPIEQLISLYQNNPHNNHWLQIIRGINASVSTHALLHDADLFVTKDDFMKTHYQTCVQRNLMCLGVSPVWDCWYKEQGIDHLTATWEIIFDISWARQFQPWKHRGHNDVINGKAHTFDTMLYPQCQTEPDKIDRHKQEWGFIHFNYVICTYRWFQKSNGPFEDDYFRILLIRLLIDVFDPSEWSYSVPTLDVLEKGITDKSNRVTYCGKYTAEHYSEFRSKLEKLITSGIIDGQKAHILHKSIRNFDLAFG
ncbi:hypothetical protein [Mastigocoleus testarum]|uniref:Uncharacterized protein n=1 Tax=Mastigocoleus testarum BC008 TaxID=371196 RepID=A0A0V7ZWY6_9CYAN|nr:hypothetical protein [Mastigocoleus testarum]KST65269.1 hypothetical protein BC008_20995 [Mastigocoleus testarum BC008]KST68942.1 hypothetical protein BC008_02380 [Mastigocoleus testarum BC008]